MAFHWTFAERDALLEISARIDAATTEGGEAPRPLTDEEVTRIAMDDEAVDAALVRFRKRSQVQDAKAVVRAVADALRSLTKNGGPND